MARNVTYSVSPRINPRDKEAAPKFYGHVQASGDINLREMSERIQQTCTVHKSDVYAVLVALEGRGDRGRLLGCAYQEGSHQLPSGKRYRGCALELDLRQGETPIHQGRQGSRGRRRRGLD